MFSLTQTKGSVPIAVSSFPDEAAERTVLAVEQMLLKAGAGEVSRAGLQVVFRTRFFYTLNKWNILYAYNRGVVKIEPNASGITVRYCVSFARRMVIVPAFFSALFLATSQSIRALAFLLSIWLCLIIPDMIIGGVRFRNWLSRGIRRKLRAERESWVDVPADAIVDFLTIAMIYVLLLIALVSLWILWKQLHR